jgi:hypothetical protein
VFILCLFFVGAASVQGCVVEGRYDGGITIRPIHIGVY